MKHTPGPWRIECDAQGPCMVMHPSKHGVAICNLSEIFKPSEGIHDPTVDNPEPCNEIENGQTYRPERVANARLIAAAPELLEACKAAELRLTHFYLVHGDDGDRRIVYQLRAAIAKAEGNNA